MGFFLLSGITAPDPQGEQAPAASLPAEQTYTVTMTGYNAVPAQTDGDPFTTASGAYSDPDLVAARSVDLADELPFGTVIEITPREGTPSGTCGIGLTADRLGYRVIADSMHPRKRNQVDILFDTSRSIHMNGKAINPAIALGICDEVEIRVVGHIDIKDMPASQTELAAALGEASLASR